MKKRKQKQSKQKGTIIQKFLEFYVQVRILSEYQQSKLPSAIITFIIILATIQELSFLFLNYGEITNGNQTNLMTLLKSIFAATRLHSPSNLEFYKLSYVIPFSIIMLYQLLIFTLFVRFILKEKKQQKLTEFLKSENQVVQILLKIYSLFHSLMYYVTTIPLLEMTIDSLFQNSTNLNIVNLTISVMAMTIVIFDYLIEIHCNLESITIHPKNLQILQVTFNNYWTSLCNFFVILIDTLNSTNKTKFYLIFSILLIRELSELWSLIWSFPNIFKRSQIVLACNFFQVTFAITLFVFSLSNNYYDTLMLVLIPPITIEIVLNKHTKFHEKIMTSSNVRFTADILQYKIANVIDDYGKLQQNYLENAKKIIYLNNFLKTHKEDCDNSKCKCNESISFEDIVFLNLRDTSKYFDSAISKTKDLSIQQAYFLHYLSLVNYLGLNTKAFQQSNILMQFDSDQYQVSSSATQHQIHYQTNSQRNKENNSSDGKSRSIQKQLSVDKKSIIATGHLKLGPLGLIQKQKLAIMQEKVKQSMSLGFQQQNAQFSENLEHAVKLFLQSEESNKKLRNKIIKMINRKREFFTNMNQINDQFSLFQTGKQLLIQMTDLENELYKLYDQFPSQKMQALNTFYQSEIMNNYFQAYKIATIASISDEKLLKMQTQTNFDLFSNKIDYLIIGFDQQTHKLVIRNNSNLIHQFFGLSQDQFKLITAIDSILPNGFDNVHEKLVSNFLQNGDSKFFRQINQNFCRYQSKFIKPIDFFYDINFINLEDLTFACFLQNNQTQNAYIFCQQNYKIIGITKNLIHKLGYDPQFNKELSTQLLKVPLNKVIPKCNLILETHISKQLNSILLETTQISEYQLLMYVPNQKALINEEKTNWDDIENLQQFNVDCVFNLKKIQYDYSYLIIEIKEIKRFQKTENTIPDASHTLGLYTNQILDSFIDLEVDDIEFAINMPKAIELYCENQTENQKNNENNDLSENVTSKLKMNERSINNSFQQPYNQQSMISPKDSGLRLIDQKNPDFNLTSIRVIHNKQQYFSANEQPQEEFSSSFRHQSSDQQKIQNTQDKVKFEEIDQDLEENLKIQMQMDSKDQKIVHIDDIGSQVSSIAGLKKSKYSKKYDLIERLTTSKRFSLNFKLVLVFFILMLTLFFIYTQFMLAYSHQDLNRFLQELDMIQIKANVIGPVNKYMVAQNAISQYSLLPLLYPSYTLASFASQMKFATLDINYTYYELKDSFSNLLTNPYLNPFFEDKYFNILVGDYPKTKNYTITARESMYLYLEASYNFVNINYANILYLDFTQGFLVFLYGNYQEFLQQLRTLNSEMVDYSINRSYSVRDKWTIILIPMLVCSCLVMIISFNFYKFFLAQYNSFLQLFGLIDMVWLQRDIDRYRGIASLLMKDSDVLFKYQFDIDIKEKFLAAEDIRKEKIAQNQRNSKLKNKQMNQINQKISIYPSLLLFSFIFGICFIFCFLTNSQGRDYFSKYPDTTRFFNSLSDLSVAISGVFAMRECSYLQQEKSRTIFYFLPDKNATFFKDTFFVQIDIINNFLALISQFESSKYLTSDKFINELEQMMQQDVCQFLPSYKIETAQSHCDILYNGVFRRGFQVAATTIRDSLLNEYTQTKYFGVKTYQLQETLEAGLIGYDIIAQLKFVFQDQLSSATNDLIQQITIINVIFIGIILIIGLITLTKVQSYFNWEFNMMKRFVLLLPQQSLFLDNQLDRILRQMIVKEQLI